MDSKTKFYKIKLFNGIEGLIYKGRTISSELPDGCYVYFLKLNSKLEFEDMSIMFDPKSYCYSLISYKPIKIVYDNIFAMKSDLKGALENQDIITFDKIPEWLEEMHKKDDHSEQVLFIIDQMFKKDAESYGVNGYYMHLMFLDKYSMHFAAMLKAQFNRGEVYITSRGDHYVWRDTDNRYYDAHGLYFKKDGEHFIDIDYIGIAFDEDMKPKKGEHFEIEFPNT